MPKSNKPMRNAFLLSLLSIFSLNACSNHDKRPPHIGNLGGINISIPREYSFGVGYEDDTITTDKHTSVPEVLFKLAITEPPVRTFESKINSLSYATRYPDMVYPSNTVIHQDYLYRNNNPSSSNWMSIIISAGNEYPQISSDFSGLFAMRDDFSVMIREPQKTKVHGLIHYKPTRMKTDPKTGTEYVRSPEELLRKEDSVLVNSDIPKKITTYLTCMNTPSAGATCSQQFDIPQMQKVRVEVSYRKGLLSEWRNIQQNVMQQILALEIQPPIN
jgi:hypothetical protein